eukprot:PRCOL_00002129-RA
MAAAAAEAVRGLPRAVRLLGGLLAELPRAGRGVVAEATRAQLAAARRAAPPGAEALAAAATEAARAAGVPGVPTTGGGERAAELSTLQRIAYVLGQPARVAFFTSQYVASLQLAPPDPALRERVASLGMRFPNMGELYDSIGQLFADDLRRLERGSYALPADLLPDVLAVARTNWKYFEDLPKIQRRRQAAARREAEERVGAQAYAGASGGERAFPEYYTQNYHWQSDGWLSDESAELYDHQVEVLFTGTADAQRRVAAAGPACDALRAAAAVSTTRAPKLLDIACGTGRFLEHLRASFPTAELHGLEMSPNYAAKARKTLGIAGARIAEGDAAAMPYESGSFDVATCVYLFHELPASVRKEVVREMARVLRPGGTVVLADSVQLGDNGGLLDALVRFFPEAYHEPYYLNYAKVDLVRLFAEEGLCHVDTTHAFLTKGMTFVKRGDQLEEGA